MYLPKESVVVAVVCAFLLSPSAVIQAEDPKWRSVIADVDVRRDAQAGEWRKLREVLEVTTTDRARILLPITPDGEYDCRVNFTRHSGADSIALIFPNGDKQTCFEVDAAGEHFAGFDLIGGKPLRENSSKTTGVRLRNGQRYQITVEVRKGEIRGLLDGKLVASHKTDGADLGISEHWLISKKDRLGLGATKGAFTIYSIEFRGNEKTSNAPPK